jgi:hypothetical protein
MEPKGYTERMRKNATTDACKTVVNAFTLSNLNATQCNANHSPAIYQAATDAVTTTMQKVHIRPRGAAALIAALDSHTSTSNFSLNFHVPFTLFEFASSPVVPEPFWPSKITLSTVLLSPDAGA